MASVPLIFSRMCQEVLDLPREVSRLSFKGDLESAQRVALVATKSFVLLGAVFTVSAIGLGVIGLGAATLVLDPMAWAVVGGVSLAAPAKKVYDYYQSEQAGGEEVLPIDEQELTVDEQELAVDEQELTVDEQELTVDEWELTIDGLELTIDEQELSVPGLGEKEWVEEEREESVKNLGEQKARLMALAEELELDPVEHRSFLLAQLQEGEQLDRAAASFEAEGLSLRSVPNDGTCFFHAVALQVPGEGGDGYDLRLRLSGFLKENKGEYQDMIGKQLLAQYLEMQDDSEPSRFQQIFSPDVYDAFRECLNSGEEGMSQLQARIEGGSLICAYLEGLAFCGHVGEFELQAMADMTGRTVRVFSPNLSSTCDFSPRAGVELDEPIHVYHNAAHYDALLPAQ